MTPARMDQLLAGFAEGDAVSQDALLLQQVFRSAGFAADLFAPAESIEPRSAGLCRPLGDYTGSAADALLFHYSIASPADAVFLRAGARRIVRYHNITPARYFEGFDDALAVRLGRGRDSLREVAAAAEAVWAVSEFNASELRALGIGGVRLLPLLFSPERFDVPPDPGVAARFAAPLVNILFVGRIAPNKRVEDLLLAFHWYHRAVNRFSRLVLVGSDRSCPRYYAMLRLLARALDLPHVCFEGFASPSALSTLYALAGAFVTASEHEGYCLPLIEAMHKGVPVIARRAGGMPEALGGAGVLYDGLGAPELGELIGAVTGDRALRAEVLASQQRRLAALRDRNVTREVMALLSEL